jgi:hypothetical protein
MAKRQSELLRFAALGALARIEELQAEIARIRKAFPTFVGRKSGQGEGDAKSPTRRKRKMSAAARKKIGDAQRKRWAKLRAGKGR